MSNLRHWIMALALVALMIGGGVAHASHLRLRTYATTTANLNLRSGPSTSHQVIDVIPEGARVYVRKGPRNGHWYRVRYGHKIGYSHGYYLTQATPTPPPNTTSYFRTLPPGAHLPSDSECASRVRRSSWEPRPANVAVNRTHPPSTYKVNGYGGMEHPELTWARVNGQANGTTDELIQHYACKWGLDEDVVRAQAVTESTWYQNLKDANGNPVAGKGYGDYGHCSGGPYGSSGPASLGIMQIKHCAHPGTLPYSETSTAFNLDYYGAVIRGCLNGWDYVTNTTGDLWGCVGRWYSGEWYRNNADYIESVKHHLHYKPWSGW